MNTPQIIAKCREGLSSLTRTREILKQCKLDYALDCAIDKCETFSPPSPPPADSEDPAAGEDDNPLCLFGPGGDHTRKYTPKPCNLGNHLMLLISRSCNALRLTNRRQNNG